MIVCNPPERSSKFVFTNGLVGTIAQTIRLDLSILSSYKQTSNQDFYLEDSEERAHASEFDYQMSKFQIQSAVLEGSAPMNDTAGAVTQEENILFDDQEASLGPVYDSLMDISYREDADALAQLGDYLSRPVVIDTFTWNESDTFTTSPHSMNPWYAYFNNAYIKKKIENYARVNCQLKLTFRFNASPFYYGVMRACYDPLNTGKFDPLTTTDLIPLSQTPGVYLEPQNASTVDITLPFLWPNNWLDVTNGDEFKNMGKLFFEIFAPLRSANGVTGAGITITTYAVAENVMIAGPTIKAALQSGPISGPATTVANVAGMMSSAPTIGPFAKAIQIGASAIAAIARMFGYSNPPVITDVQPFQNKVFHAFANVETSVPIDKLSVDPTNEVTIDTRVAGADGTDELSLTNLVTRKSYLLQTSWVGSDAAYTKLFSIAVTPTPGIDVVQTYQTLKYHTPASFGGRMFWYWHGTMKYTFKVVRSQYHKGRLILSWDPTGSVATSGAETALFSKVYDLSEESDEITFEIPYKATQPWLKNSFLLGSFAARAGTYVHDPSSCNGTLTCSVQNVLTGPAASPTCDILVYSEACDDMQYSVPQDLPTNLSSFTVQSGPIDGSGMSYTEHLPDVTVGERVASLRPLLHRTSFALTQYLGLYANGQANIACVIRSQNFYNRLPPEPGFNPNGFNRATSVASTGTKICTYAATHPINFVLAAFAGYRGSTVVHANISTNGTVENMSSLSLTRMFNDTTINGTQVVRNANYSAYDVTSPLNNMSYVAVADFVNGMPGVPAMQEGGTLTNGKTQMAMSCVVPQYCQHRFYPAWAPYRNIVPTNSNRSLGELQVENVRLDAAFCKDSDPATSFPRVDMYYAAGVDFCPVFFTGVPRLYSYVMGAPA
jgi:hypothetical protein